MSHIRLFLAVVVLSVSGCQAPKRAALSSDNNIVAGVKVFGPKQYWSETKIIALKTAVSTVDHIYPIMHITFIDAETAEVITGVMRGPLNGEGHNYTFKLKDGRWVTAPSRQLPWVS